jgi:hypothetical protein
MGSHASGNPTDISPPHKNYLKSSNGTMPTYGSGTSPSIRHGLEGPLQMSPKRRHCSPSFSLSHLMLLTASCESHALCMAKPVQLSSPHHMSNTGSARAASCSHTTSTPAPVTQQPTNTAASVAKVGTSNRTTTLGIAAEITPPSPVTACQDASTASSQKNWLPDTTPSATTAR